MCNDPYLPPPFARARRHGHGRVCAGTFALLHDFLWLHRVFPLILFGFNNATYASRIAVRYAVVHGSTATYTCTSTDISNIITPLLWGAPSGHTTVNTTWSPEQHARQYCNDQSWHSIYSQPAVVSEQDFLCGRHRLLAQFSNSGSSKRVSCHGRLLQLQLTKGRQRTCGQSLAPNVYL